MLAEGWAEPDTFENRVGTCPDQTLLWHMELDPLPCPEEARALAYAVGYRFEDAWGMAQRRFLAHRATARAALIPAASTDIQEELTHHEICSMNRDVNPAGCGCPGAIAVGEVINEGTNIGGADKNIYCVAVHFPLTGEVVYYDKDRVTTLED